MPSTQWGHPVALVFSWGKRMRLNQGPEKKVGYFGSFVLPRQQLSPLRSTASCCAVLLTFPVLLAELWGGYRQTVIRWRAVWGRVSVGGELFHHQRCTVNLDGLAHTHIHNDTVMRGLFPSDFQLVFLRRLSLSASVEGIWTSFLVFEDISTLI